MQPGHPNWMLDTNRDSRLPHRPSVERAMERWFFSPRRHVPGRLLEAMRRECSGLVLSNAQPATAVPFLSLRGGSGCPSSRTSRAGTTRSARESSRRTATSTSSRTRSCRTTCVATTGSRRSAFGSPAGRRRISSIGDGRAPSTSRCSRTTRWTPRARWSLVGGQHAEQRAVRGAVRRAPSRVAGREPRDAARSCSSGPHPRDRDWRAAVRAPRTAGTAWRSRRRASRTSRTLRRCCSTRTRRLQRGHDPPRRARRRPAGRVRPLRRRRAARASRGRRRTSSASTTRSSPRPAPSIGPSRFEEVVAGIEQALAQPDELAAQRRRAVEQVVGIVDGRAAERVVDAIADMLGVTRREGRDDPARAGRGGRRRRAGRVPPARRASTS